MAKELSALKVRGRLGEILEEVFYRGEEYIIKRGKKTMAVLISPDEFENYKKQKGVDMGVFDSIRAKTKGHSKKEVEADIREAIESVRKHG